MRTTRNGDSLSAASLLYAAIETDFNDEVELREFGKDLRSFGQQCQAEGFDKGMQLGAKVENGVAVQALVTALLRVIGDDQGDGFIDLGKVGTWYPGKDDSSAVKKGA